MNSRRAMEGKTALAFQAIRFALAGALGFAVGIATLYILTEHAGLHYLTSMLIALCVVNVLGWLVNRKWTFRSSSPHRLREFLRFAAVNAGAFLVTLAAMAILVDLLGMNYLLASVVVGISMAGINFVVHRWWSFRAGRMSAQVRS